MENIVSKSDLRTMLNSFLQLSSAVSCIFLLAVIFWLGPLFQALPQVFVFVDSMLYLAKLSVHPVGCGGGCAAANFAEDSESRSNMEDVQA